MSELTKETVLRMAKLSQIGIKEDELDIVKEKLLSTLDILNRLQEVDTEGVLPMSDPFDRMQICREDVVTEEDHRDEYQKIAPSVEDGLYLVPKVLD